jgi:predicted enzyme involved in methoxymalonyl-ACP biosynthesis
MRLHDFPVQWLAEVSWSRKPNNLDEIAHQLSIIADDFILARDNSLGLHKPKLENAEVSQN